MESFGALADHARINQEYWMTGQAVTDAARDSPHVVTA